MARAIRGNPDCPRCFGAGTVQRKLPITGGPVVARCPCTRIGEPFVGSIAGTATEWPVPVEPTPEQRATLDAVRAVRRGGTGRR